MGAARKAYFAMFLILAVFGMFALLIVSHEAYHYFAVDGEPKGVCFGNCEMAGKGAVGAVVWERTDEQINNFDSYKEEKNAWIFSFSAIIVFLALFMILLRFKD